MQVGLRLSGFGLWVQGPILEFMPEIDAAQVFFVGANLGVIFFYEDRENWVDCEIELICASKKAGLKETVERTARLTSLLASRGVRDLGTRDVSQIDSDKRVDAILEEYARLLKRYGSEILQDSRLVFEPRAADRSRAMP